jgi:hypothetical protein
MASDTPFNRWYEKNKEEYNARRKERYYNDPEYRARIDEYRKTRKNRHKSKFGG